MGIALLTLSHFFQGFAPWGQKSPTTPATAHPHAARVLRTARPATNRPAVTPRPITSVCASRQPIALRVVHVCDTHSPAGEMGRLVISGRMADVCAELDRLVAHENAQHSPTHRH